MDPHREGTAIATINCEDAAKALFPPVAYPCHFLARVCSLSLSLFSLSVFSLCFLSLFLSLFFCITVFFASCSLLSLPSGPYNSWVLW